jgi:channel protein (hemolysin III family)
MPAHTIIPISGFSEPFSSMTHLFAAGIFLILGIWLVQRGRDSLTKVTALGIFAFSSVFLLSMSGVFHLLEPQGIARDVLQRLDHAGVFFLIAGTFTAVHSILFRGIWRWGMLLMIWTIAITSITLKTIYFHDLSEWLGLSLYLGMGWIGAISGIVLYRRFGFTFIKPLIYGALAYTIGAIMEFMRMPVLIPGVIGPHELFHVAVLAGLGYHFAFVLSFSKFPAPASITSPGN